MPNLMDLPVELRFNIFDILFATTTRKVYEGISMANHLCKKEVDTAFKYLTKQLKAVNCSEHPDKSLRVEVELPTSPQTTYNLQVTVHANLETVAPTDMTSFLEDLLRPVLAVNVESITLKAECFGLEDKVNRPHVKSSALEWYYFYYLMYAADFELDKHSYGIINSNRLAFEYENGHEGDFGGGEVNKRWNYKLPFGAYAVFEDRSVIC